MSAMFWRIIIAVVVVLLVYALIPPVVALLGFGINPNAIIIIRICIIGIAILYVLRGPNPPAIT